MKKKIRMMVTTMIEIETELEPKEAVEEFEQNCEYNYPNTDNVKVIDIEWRETKPFSVLQVNKSNTEILLKPLK